MNEPASNTAKIKGAAFREFVAWYELHHHGSAVLRQTAERMPDALRALVRPDEPALGLIASRWYPAALAHTVMDGVSRGLDADARSALVRESTRAVVALMMRGVYRFLFESVASPALYARYIQRVWSQLHDTGERVITLDGPTSGDSWIRHWPGHHPMLCEITTETMAEAFRAMKCRDVAVRRLGCVSHGASECHARVEWR